MTVRHLTFTALLAAALAGCAASTPPAATLPQGPVTEDKKTLAEALPGRFDILLLDGSKITGAHLLGVTQIARHEKTYIEVQDGSGRRMLVRLDHIARFVF